MTVMALHPSDRHDRLRRAGDWLRTIRREHGLSQGELAGLVGTSIQNISNYERGQVEVPDDKGALIAAAFGISEIEARRGLELYVPGDLENVPAPGPVDVLAAIRNDMTLLPEAKRHLLNQYQLLRRIAPKDATVTPIRSKPSADLAAPAVARKRTPKRPT